jgi:Ribbon-helix-helix protein, copG family
MSKSRASDEDRDLYEHRHDAGEWEDEAEAIEVRPSKSAVLSVRLPREILDTLEDTAAASGQSLSEFVRAAIEHRLRGYGNSLPSVVNRSVGYPTARSTQDDRNQWSQPAEVPEVSKSTLVGSKLPE